MQKSTEQSHWIFAVRVKVKLNWRLAWCILQANQDVEERFAQNPMIENLNYILQVSSRWKSNTQASQRQPKTPLTCFAQAHFNFISMTLPPVCTPPPHLCTMLSVRSTKIPHRWAKQNFNVREIPNGRSTDCTACCTAIKNRTTYVPLVLQGPVQLCVHHQDSSYCVD